MSATDGSPPAEAVCPSCGRFVGPADTCPYCGADSVRAPLFHTFRYVAVALALVGLAFLYAMARQSRPHPVRGAELTPPMHCARVRMEGVVTGVAVGKSGGVTNYLAITVEEEGEEKPIQVRAYRDTARRLVQGGAIPTIGSRVQVDGEVRFGADRRVYLVLHSPEDLRVLAPPSMDSAQKSRNKRSRRNRGP